MSIQRFRSGLRHISQTARTYSDTFTFLESLNDLWEHKMLKQFFLSCRNLIGLFTWHLEFKPPDGVDVSVFPPPSLSLAEEDMYRAHVLVERYSKNTMSNNSDDYFQLIDPYFCGGDVCSWWVDDLKPGRSYIFRVRSFNYAGMGDYGMIYKHTTRINFASNYHWLLLLRFR